MPLTETCFLFLTAPSLPFLELMNNALAPLPMELPLTRHTRWPAAKVGLEWARLPEQMAEVLVKALQLRNDTLTPFPMELPLTRHT